MSTTFDSVFLQHQQVLGVQAAISQCTSIYVCILGCEAMCMLLDSVFLHQGSEMFFKVADRELCLRNVVQRRCSDSFNMVTCPSLAACHPSCRSAAGVQPPPQRPAHQRNVPPLHDSCFVKHTFIFDPMFSRVNHNEASHALGHGRVH